MNTHYRALLGLGLPIVIGQIGVIVLGFADTIMVGHHSSVELAAASFVNNMFNLAIIFSTGFAYGLTPVVGRLFGEKKTFETGQVLKNSLLANTVLAALVCALLLALYLNLDRLGQPDELIPYMRPYFMVLFVSLPFVLWFNAFKQFSDGITDTKVSMWILLGGNLLNIIGNYILIYGKLGLPEMGLTGAGLSTLISRILMVVAYVVLFFFTNRYRHFRKGFSTGKINRADFTLLNRLGWPIAAQMGMETASFSLSAIMVGWLGSTELATYQVMIAVSQICFMMYYGMGAAVSVRISNFLGQRDFYNVNRTANTGFHIILVMIICTSVPIYLLRHHIGGWFTDDASVSLMVAQVIVPFLLYQFGDGLQINFANALRGIADVRPMMLFSFIAYFVISLPLGYIFGFTLNWGITGIWMAFPFGLTSAGIMYYLRFRYKVKTLDNARY
ncbi:MULTISPECIES: MATE family efflux transporter [Bacteroides]|uniref:MATE family efflux transporter n=1 Tax=Bacteroides TaxID=816 RepID=UPI000B384FA9|nr:MULTISPECIES: MATE family efflux transporter [Bacteroides]MBM6946215.1 MATE family efflux transporter [Bacteroides gallinaceum]MDN0067736.1 MATE family efflux transporter [Bacteroides gallinaceum]OUO50761.1 MATE family efflux transporter [Bacteroides sp. An279]